MKKSQDIIGLPVFSIIDGKEIGQVKDLVVNPDEGSIEFLLVNDENWYVGAKVLPFRAVLGIGQDAVTTESENQLQNISDSSNASTLLQKAIKIKGNRILTRTGNLVGVVTEFSVDDNSGKVLSVDFNGIVDSSAPGMLTAAQIVTFGRDVLVINDKFEGSEAAEPVKPAETEPPAAQESGAKETDASRLFVEKQKQFLLGKVITRDVKDDQGNVLLAEGTVVDAETLQIAEANGKLVELSQNTK